MRFHSFVLFLSLLCVVNAAKGQPFLDSLKPQPRQAYIREIYSAVFSIDPSVPILVDPSVTSRAIASELNAGLRARGFDTCVVRAYTPADSNRRCIFLSEPSQQFNDFLRKIPDQKIQLTSSYPGAEGYILDVMAQHILIGGSDSVGLRYGVQTLMQLIDVVPPRGALRCCRIVDAPEFPKRWYYYSTNVQVGANITKAKQIADQAARWRCNGVLLSDGKFDRITTVPSFYFDSLRSLVRYYRARDVEVIPGTMPFGYSNALLFHDQNLASGLPVRDQKFVIEADTARLVPHITVAIPNGDFESYQGNSFSGFRFIDKPGQISFVDTSIKHSGKASVRFENFAQFDPTHGHGRVSYWTRVHPFTYYHVSAWVRTESLQPSGCAQTAVLSNAGYSLSYYEPNIPATTSGWRKVDFVFNSLGADTVGLYFGTWGATSGKIWWDDVSFEEVAFVNLIRRAGAPLIAKHPTLAVIYREGTDFDTLRDARLGITPWPGAYDTYHTPPTFRRRSGGTLKNGDTVLISYHHMIVIYDGQVAATMSDPRVYSIVEREFRVLDSLIGAHTYFMHHDEIRTMNWDEGDLSRGLTPGQILADNVQKCVDIIHRRVPAADVWVWTDMFDEFHNAVKKNYYLVNGDLTGSADVIPKSIGMMNWNGRDGIVQKSLDFFAQKGFRQMSAPYYDGDENDIRVWKEWTRTTPRFHGMMYTTWQSKYTHLEPFGEYAWNHAPHIFHDPPTVIVTSVPMSFTTRIIGDRWDKGWALQNATMHYRTSPGVPFTTQAIQPNIGVPVSAQLTLPANTRWIQWYFTATDSRGWMTKIPFGDTVYFELGSLPTSIQNSEKEPSFMLHGTYPLPATASQGLTIEWSHKNARSLRAVLLDLFGREIERVEFEAHGAGLQTSHIPTANIPTGTYMLRLISENRIVVKRISVMR